MNLYAQWVGYAVMFLSSLTAVSAGAVWVLDLVLRNTQTKALVLQWYAERLKKKVSS